MCGIVGFIGRRNAAPVLLEGLRRLEYRGYDSAGLALLDGGAFTLVRRKGRVSALEDAARGKAGNVGIGHTRWATHGAPSERNAHPHIYGKFAVVHNGIIENYRALKKECEESGETFASDTDSEVIAHLLAKYDEGDFLAAVRRAVAGLRGSYALAILCEGRPDELIAARKGSPLIVGERDGEWYVASDIPALAGKGMKLCPLSDGEIAVLKRGGAAFFDIEEKRIEKEWAEYDTETSAPQLCGYPHFMRKEIDEIPASIAQTAAEFLKKPANQSLCEVLCHTEYVQIVACGTAYHSGLAAKCAIEALARIPAEACIASEYRYRDPVVGKNTLVVAVSQSGETADTLAAARLAKERGAYLIAVANVPHSSLTALADHVIPTAAGTEIGVAATKSYNAQLIALYLLALSLRAAKSGARDVSSSGLASQCERDGEDARLLETLRALPALCGEAIAASRKTKEWARRFCSAKSVYFIGRGCDHAAAVEGSLKLKEISYLPSEGYPAGELKHGTLALIGRDTPIVAVMTDRALAEKTMNSVHEAISRGADAYLVTSLPEYAERKEFAASILVPACERLFSPAVSVIPLQLLAYETALACGNDPDKPRNLAKSVTVE